MGSALPMIKSDVSAIDIDMGKPGVDFAGAYLYNLTSHIGLDLRWRYISLSKAFVTTSNELGNMNSGSFLHFGFSLSRKFGG